MDIRNEHGRADRGTNQSGMRDYNERLVLSLVRRSHALAKSDIARITGLSAQTVSVITRALENEGLLIKGEPQRGKVGQPSVPMSLRADGAYFFGLKIGRRSTELCLIDFRGTEIAAKKKTYTYPTTREVLAFVESEIRNLTRRLPQDAVDRISGLGVAMPYNLASWASVLDAPKAELERWEKINMRDSLRAITDWDVFVENDATAACGAELVFGKSETPRDFLYFYIGFFVGGGVVLNGGVYSGPSGNAGALGSMLIPDGDGPPQQLVNQASIYKLEAQLSGIDRDPLSLWDDPEDWNVPDDILDEWVTQVSAALAYAIAGATSVIDFSAVLIDGWLPGDVRRRIVAETRAAFADLEPAGIDAPDIKEASVGPQARSLGAASLPLSERFMVDQNAV